MFFFVFIVLLRVYGPIPYSFAAHTSLELFKLKVFVIKWICVKFLMQ